jgi:uncharacterized protein YjbI with pentapeptide repeats
MIHRHICFACALLFALAAVSRADIFRWDNGALIPGTQGITPGPGVQLSNRYLQYARLSQTNLTGANFTSSDLTEGSFYSSTLDGANLSGAILSGASFLGASLMSANLSGAYLLGETDLDHSNLTNANLSAADLTNANLSRATLDGANLTGATIKGTSLDEVSGLNAEQFYSTASYQAKDLQGILFISNDLTGWDFSGQNLTDAWFHRCSLANADLRGANLTNVELTSATLAGANFEGAIVNDADLENITSSGFSKDQLYSTASYQAKDLRRIRLYRNDLSGWDFRGQNLSGTSFQDANLTNADLTGAVVTGTSFAGTTSLGFTKEQLYSTASYQAKDLRGISLFNDDLTGWDFSGRDLTGALFFGTKLTNVDFADAVVTGTWFGGSNVTKEQLYSTRSYQTRDLRGIQLGGIGVYFNFRTDLAGWDFNAQDLSNAYLSYASLAGADLRGANLTGAELKESDLTRADTRGTQGLDLSAVVTRGAILPNGTINGLVLEAGERLVLRDEDGVPGPSSDWRIPRPPIPVTIEDGVTLAESSALQLLFEADSWDSLISFENGTPIELGGALELRFADDVDLATQVGRTLRLFDWTGVSPTGQFAIRSPYVWDVTNLYTTGQVTLLAVPEPSALGLMGVACMRLVATRRNRGRLAGGGDA